MKRLRALLSVLALLALAVSVDAVAGTSKVVCKYASTTSMQILPANSARASYSVWTTSATAILYIGEGVTAVDPTILGTTTGSSFVVGGGLQSYTSDPGVTTQAINVIARTGAPYVCAKDSAK